MPESIEADEHQRLDYKSLQTVTGPRAAWDELAGDCVCFANGSGGRLVIGIEDDKTPPPADQRLDPSLPERVAKRVKELTVNVEVVGRIEAHPRTGGDLLVLDIPRAAGVASTSKGRYFVRVGDACQPVVGDDILRLISERPQVPWEFLTTQGVARAAADPVAVGRLLAGLRGSDRVKPSVKDKTEGELLTHYNLADEGRLTNLGVLLLGTPADRSRLGSFPIVQALKYDNAGNKVYKQVWDDYTLSPVQLVGEIWATVPDFREAYEIPSGLLRVSVPAFAQEVVRELLVNALVHRPYTQRGDIFLNLHPDRLEVVNPGRLPLGVTPANILHISRRRNEGLARVFHDLGLMEREGSGFDLMYERLLASGRREPTVVEGQDWVRVTVGRNVIAAGVIGLIADADARYQLSQREHISLGLLAQTEGLSAAELGERLEIDASEVEHWLGRLPQLGLVEKLGKGRGTRYLVDPALLRSAGLDGKTTLATIQPHRLRELVLTDVAKFPDSGRADIHRRIGLEISPRAISRTLRELVDEGLLITEGQRRWRVYRVHDTARREDG
jgi:ATP-dependent DNA helicase RecG